MATLEIKSHEVKVFLVTDIAPLSTNGGKFLSPDQGVLITLSNGASVRWKNDAGKSSPSVGDYYADDSVLGTQFILTPKQFIAMFPQEG